MPRFLHYGVVHFERVTSRGQYQTQGGYDIFVREFQGKFYCEELLGNKDSSMIGSRMYPTDLNLKDFLDNLDKNA